MSKAKAAPDPIEDFYLRLLTRGKPRKIEIGAPDSDPIARVIEAVTESILRFARATGKDAEIAESLRSDRILIRTIPPAGIEALTMWIAPRHVVAVNRGLAMFIYRLARAISPHVIVRGADDPAAPPETETADIIATLLDWMASPVRAPLVEDWPVGPREIKTAENFTTAAERFVVAHEIGHIVRGHLIADAGKVDLAKASPLELDTRPLKQEIEADVTGTFLSIESMEKDRIDPRAAVAGIYFFFRALHLAEMVGAIEVDEAHPPAEERLATCEHVIGERYQSQAPILLQWGFQTDALLSRLAEMALKKRNQRRTATAARIEEVLRTTPWRMHKRVPARDKALLEKVQSLMSQSPSAVVEALAANMLDADAYKQLAAAFPSLDALEQDERWRRHQVAHFIARNAPVPVKQALGVEL